MMNAVPKSTKLTVLVVLCLQNSLYTVMRRYSQGILHEKCSKHEILLVAELIKFAFSAMMVSRMLVPGRGLWTHIKYLILASRKMFFLAVMYGGMNILSFIALSNIDAGTFTIFAQLKILTTATFSTILLQRRYSYTKWRALIELMLGTLLFSSHIFSNAGSGYNMKGNPILGVMAVVIEVTTSGFASIYFEKVIKTSQDNLNIWERNLQLAVGSTPIYVAFILHDLGGDIKLGMGWSKISLLLSFLGAAGGLLVALSIKYADAILKTLSTTSAIVLSSVLDHWFLGGPLSPVMAFAGGIVVLAIMNYTFDRTPEEIQLSIHSKAVSSEQLEEDVETRSLKKNEDKA